VSSPYRIAIAKLRRDLPASTDLSLSAPFDEERIFDPKGEAETDIAWDAPIDLQVKIESYSGGLRVKGRLSAPWRGTCRRCSKIVDGLSEIVLNERFVDPEELTEDFYPIDKDFIDLAPMVHDAVFLDLPLAPLCSADCQGLCPYCGIDRNEARCECQGETDPRWATLDSLSFDNEEPATGAE
jgi:uncharacterized protein